MGQNDFSIILKREYDHTTHTGWKGLLQWDDEKGRTGYLLEYVENGEITLHLKNEYGDVIINGYSIMDIANMLNRINAYIHISQEIQGDTWTEILKNIPSYSIRMFSIFSSSHPGLLLGSNAITHTLVVFKSFSEWGFVLDIGHDANDIWFTSLRDGDVAGWQPLILA